METIGKRIKAVRDSLDISQKAFGARIGLSQTTLTALENDKNEPSMGTFNKIVEEFRVNPEWLRVGVGQMKISGQPADPTPAPIEAPAAPLSIVLESDREKEYKETIRELREHNQLLRDILRSGGDLNKLGSLSFLLGSHNSAEDTCHLRVA